MLFDIPLADLEAFRPDVLEPRDFDEFWSSQLDIARRHPLNAEFTPVESRVTHADIFDLTFAGHGGNRVKGWLLVPHHLAVNPSMVVEFVGYGGGRGSALDWLSFSCAGHVHMVMDTRGQGGAWRGSDTSDLGETGAPGGRGFLTRGILKADEHYYTRLFVDSARAVEAARAHPGATNLPIVTTGGSQGGGLALASAHLADNVAGTMPDVPFPSNFAHAVRTTPLAPYSEIIEYCAVYPDRVERVFESLSYVDIANHVKRIDCPALFSVGLVDEITPASTVYSAYNRYAGPKAIEVYPYNGHEGGGTRQFAQKLAFLAELPVVREV